MTKITHICDACGKECLSKESMNKYNVPTFESQIVKSGEIIFKTGITTHSIELCSMCSLKLRDLIEEFVL